MTLETGSKVGPYEIESPIGAGGMGEVYRARDTRLDRTVAIKVLPAHLAQDPHARQRFEREARAVSSLTHPHICTLHDVGFEEDIAYLVMEYLEGETLEKRLERGPLEGPELLDHAIQIADALDKAHRQGVIHRDLKPGNVMLTKEGAKLLDFGLARSAVLPGGDSSLTAAATATSPLTAEGTIVGTFQYMAPEQLEGEIADVRSDIFAFGTTLYEMATGRKAFQGKTQASLIASILEREPPPIASVQPLSPPALERLVRTCVAKDPNERRQSMHDVLLDLKWIAEAGSQAGVPIPVTTRRRVRARLAWSLAALFFVAATVLAVMTARLASREEPVVRAFVPPPPGAIFDFTGRRPGLVQISPDGKRLVFGAEDESGEQILWVREVDALAARPLAATAGAEFPFWSPDSESIAYFADGKLRKIDAAGGPSIPLCDVENGPKGGTWGSKGTIVFTPSNQNPLFRVSSAGGDPVQITEVDEDAGYNGHRLPHFLPDGKHFLFVARKPGSSSAGQTEGTVMLGSVDGDEPRVIMERETNAIYSSGHMLYIQEGVLMAQPFDAGRGETTGEAFPIAEHVEFHQWSSFGVFSASRNGVLVYQADAPDETFRLGWFNREGKPDGTLGEPAAYDDPRISPDGRHVAIAIADVASGNADIWIYEIVRGIRTRFTTDEAFDRRPVWSPDGREIVFTSNRGDTGLDLYRKSFVVPEEPSLVVARERGQNPVSWSPDGRYISYQEGANIYAQPLEDGAEPIPISTTDFLEFGPQFSPDGQWVLFVSNETGEFEWFATPFPGPGRKWQISAAGADGSAHWTRGGREIVYVDPENRLVAVDVQAGPGADELTIGAPRILFDLPGTIEDYDVTADGERFLFVQSPTVQADEPLTLVVNWTADIGK